MRINCPICGSEYDEGSVRFCNTCMYSVGADRYLTDLLNHPSEKDLEIYNAGIEEYKSLWRERNPEKKFVVSGLVEMIDVDGGTFQMGSNDGESDQKPVHLVTVGSFQIGRTELTLGSFEEFINSTNYRTDADKEGSSYIWMRSDLEERTGVNWRCDTKGNFSGAAERNHPVIHVSWKDAVAYCDWLSEKERLQKAYSGNGGSITCDFNANGYRLPTEAEWEYAARGGSKSKGYKYSGSNKIDEVAWYWKNSGRKTHEVGTKQPNELGIYDMSGNVWEWCWDRYGDYSSSSQMNPRGASSGSNRVFRGGSWLHIAEDCRVANRGDETPDTKGSVLGFRLARTKK